ncbi:hypothetical protein BABINDRAFT_160978 [Babjeviella inositovora NRRL Y-12698]|uniref:C2H2-type domain-containing protein n=1 Tax=Babjeviella inositovora NRRL Y-12698 TaxID=984486 RepID=A0A1E3QTC3_9ASCO|nr:uncharacterized protein BABINDRAFT_160978 [Babjeviella inositovora NRRL Y-12698]ODQ80764.1 hypothetical protein BABINDRAFT_160978 [Babjeviella inositovora NRRL Y-12698]
MNNPFESPFRENFLTPPLAESSLQSPLESVFLSSSPYLSSSPLRTAAPLPLVLPTLDSRLELLPEEDSAHQRSFSSPVRSARAHACITAASSPTRSLGHTRSCSEPSPDTKEKRKRRKKEEIVRLYLCGYQGCDKAYGTLNHLNIHTRLMGHGAKRLPEEFKEIRTRWRLEKKRAENANLEAKLKQEPKTDKITKPKKQRALRNFGLETGQTRVFQKSVDLLVKLQLPEDDTQTPSGSSPESDQGSGRKDLHYSLVVSQNYSPSISSASATTPHLQKVLIGSHASLPGRTSSSTALAPQVLFLSPPESVFNPLMANEPFNEVASVFDFPFPSLTPMANSAGLPLFEDSSVYSDMVANMNSSYGFGRLLEPLEMGKSLYARSAGSFAETLPGDYNLNMGLGLDFPGFNQALYPMPPQPMHQIHSTESLATDICTSQSGKGLF